jgi:uncharacterized Zn finger protein
MIQLNLDNYKKVIASHILQRGRDYYYNGHVISLEKVGEGHWSANVKGTITYTAEIQLDDNGDIYHDCTCPYDWGPTCKHIAAVLYAIEATFPECYDSKPRKPRKRRRTRKDKVRAILESLSNQQLVSILTEIATNDRQVALTLLARFGSEGEGKKAYIRMAKDALKLGQDRGGFIDYWGAPEAARGLWEILNRAEELVRHGNYSESISIAQAILETAIPAIEYTDDSTGALGGCIDSTCEILADVAMRLDGNLRHELFEYCLEKAPVDPFIEWDWGWFFAQLAADLITTQEERIRVFEMLDKMASRRGATYDDSPFSSTRYDHERAALIKLTVIQHEDEEYAALGFMEEHLHLHPMRRRLIKHYMETGEFETVKQLCQEWLKNYSQNAPGLREEYLGSLLEVARLEGEKDQIKQLARELFLDTGKFDYYDLFKQTIPEDTWQTCVEQIVNDLDERPRVRHLTAEIFVRESMWERLLETALNGGEYLLDGYREFLEPRFPAEIFQAYKQIVYVKLERTSSRAIYADTAEYLTRLIKLGYKKEVEEIIHDLISMYPRRKAMIEELRSVLPE